MLETGPRYRFGDTSIEQSTVHDELVRRYLRYRSGDWLNQTDPQLSIACLSAVGPKKRLTPDEVRELLALVQSLGPKGKPKKPRS